MTDLERAILAKVAEAVEQLLKDMRRVADGQHTDVTGTNLETLQSEISMLRQSLVTNQTPE
ncbi:hypothetical protein [Gluconobacter oxydans]|uniref:hypothetical protein n=1 Tax=Gluconobacter oxydans TaxID=442 RepID=UPI0039E73A1C